MSNCRVGLSRVCESFVFQFFCKLCRIYKKNDGTFIMICCYEFNSVMLINIIWHRHRMCVVYIIPIAGLWFFILSKV